ncbi:MAG TPA: hypothetical protein VN285_05355 [Candidatus Deferrimicrobium sp.]|nr:hypothetical protein [Candidatus Deferrimicrobium sp.]
MKKLMAGVAALCLLFLAGCSDREPVRSSDDTRSPLAGGGRLENSDPFIGGSGDSGPGKPDIEPYTGLVALFYADFDCDSTPRQEVISNAEAWESWWQKANACLGWGVPGDSGGWDDGDSIWRDSFPIDSGYPIDSIYPCSLRFPGMQEVPYVNFDSNVVIAIALEPDSGFGRSLWVEEVTSSEAGSIVRYVVSQLGEDCYEMLMMPIVALPTSPTIAVMAPRPFHEPVTWERRDTTFSCWWEPDPNAPWTLYYTDGACDLGPNEALITDQTSWEGWLKTAMACDSARWYNPDDSIIRPGDSTIVGGHGWSGQPIWWPPYWDISDVDFSTHAVIVLRAGVQTRWGGGIWLDVFETGAGGTTIEYRVMQPAENCPAVEGDQTAVNPTVAIRVPLPLPEPITFKGSIEVIDCNWGVDSSWVYLDSGGWR